MSINLSKGETISLKKDGNNIRRIEVGTAWGLREIPKEPKKEVVQEKQNKGFFNTLGDLFQGKARVGDVVNSVVDGTKNTATSLTRDVKSVMSNNRFDVSIDIDTSVFIFNNKNKYVSQVSFCSRNYNNVIKHLGDDTTGSNHQGLDGDNETITVDLEKLDSNIEKLFVVTNVYSYGHFGQAGCGYIRLVNSDNKEEICRSYISKDLEGKTGMVVAEIYRHSNGWRFNVISDSNSCGSIEKLKRECEKKYLNK